MGDMIQQGLQWLANMQRGGNGLTAQAAQQITYMRGATQAKVNATVQQTAFRTSDAGAKSKLSWSEVTAEITVADLVAAGITMPPKQTDTFQYTPPGSGTPKTYGLFHVPNEKPYKMDAHEIAVLVYAKAQ